MGSKVLIVDDHQELASLLGTAVEGRGLCAVVTTCGQEALDSVATARPDAAIVDLLLPDMLGVIVVDALRALDPPVPVIAISGVFRQEPSSHPIVVEHGASSFMEKPFSTKALLETLRALLLQEDPSGTSAGLSASLDPEAELEEAMIEEELASTIEGPASFEAEAAAVHSIQPSRSGPNEPQGASQRRRRMGFVEDLVDAASAPVDPLQILEANAARLVAIPKKDPSLVRTESTPPPNSGSLSTTSYPRLLVASYVAGLSGALVLKNDKQTRVVYLEEGRPVFAASNLGADRLLALAVRQGAVRKQDATAALRLASETGRKAGELLIELGVIDRAGLAKLLRMQVLRIVLGCFRWNQGSYRLRSGVPHPGKIWLQLGLTKLLLRGFDQFEASELETLCPSRRVLGPASAPPIAIDKLELQAEEAKLLVLADGTKSVEDLGRLIGDELPHPLKVTLSAFEALGLLIPQTQMLASIDRMGFVL